MQGITDMHSHILPGVDDGAGSLAESMETLSEAVRQGITAMIATPHFYPERYEASPAQLRGAFWRVREECRRQGLPISLYLGQECMYYSGLAEKLRRGEVLTMAGSRYVLVEFEPTCAYRYLAGGLHEVRSAGYIPILAHFERYACLFREDHLAELKSQGFPLQMNFDRLLEPDRFFRKNPWRQYVREGMVDYLGSDCHGTHFRPLRVGWAREWLETRLEEPLRKKILETNIDKIVTAQDA